MATQQQQPSPFAELKAAGDEKMEKLEQENAQLQERIIALKKMN
jgi:hypothetical protein